MSYLTESQINQMARAAMRCYEFSCSWSAALGEAVEYSINEFGIKPRKSAALLALKLAKLNWYAVSNSVAQKINEENMA